MKRWPIGLALIGSLLAVGIGVCAGGDPTPPARIESTESSTLTPAPTAVSEVSTADEPAPIAESASPHSVEPAIEPASLVLEIVAPNGTPVPNARVVLARGETVLADTPVENDGRVKLPSLGRNVDLFVLTQLAMRHRHHLDYAVGHHVIRLPGGAALRGTVLVDGAAPDRPVWLILASYDERSGLEPPPMFVQRQIDFRGYVGHPSLGVYTDATGRFEFPDLPATLTGTLSFTGDYSWESEGPLNIRDVSRDVVLRLRRSRLITGRVVMSDSTTVAPDAYGTLEAECADGWSTNEFRTNAQGAFWIRMPCQQLSRFDATVALAGIGRAAIELRDVPEGGIDVGDVVLEPARDICFVVHDREGRPIDAAYASTMDEKPSFSKPTDSSGKSTLTAVPITTDLIRVFAHGFRFVTRGVNAGEATERAPLDIEMERIAHLDISVETRDGKPVPGVRVRLTCRCTLPFIAGENGDGSHPIDIELGAPHCGGIVTSYREGEEVEYAFEYFADPAGRLRIPGVNPLAHFVARVEDMTDTVLAERDIDAAIVDSNTVCRIVIDGAPRLLELLVFDADSGPIRAAKLISNYGFPLGETLSDGVVQIGPIYAMKVDLRVEAEGYPAAPLREVEMSHDKERRKVVMTRSRPLRVHFVDSRGQTIAAEGVEAKFEGKSVGKVSRCTDGEGFLIDELPPERIELSAFVGGVRFTKKHDARESVAQFEVQEHGSVLIEFSEPLALPSRFVVVLAPEPSSQGASSAGAELTRTIASKSPVSSLDFPVVFPGRYTVTVRELNPADGADPLRSRDDGLLVQAGERTVVHSVLRRAR